MTTFIPPPDKLGRIERARRVQPTRRRMNHQWSKSLNQCGPRTTTMTMRKKVAFGRRMNLMIKEDYEEGLRDLRRLQKMTVGRTPLCPACPRTTNGRLQSLCLKRSGANKLWMGATKGKGRGKQKGQLAPFSEQGTFRPAQGLRRRPRTPTPTSSDGDLEQQNEPGAGSDMRPQQADVPSHTPTSSTAGGSAVLHLWMRALAAPYVCCVWEERCQQNMLRPHLAMNLQQYQPIRRLMTFPVDRAYKLNKEDFFWTSRRKRFRPSTWC